MLIACRRSPSLPRSMMRHWFERSLRLLQRLIHKPKQSSIAGWRLGCVFTDCATSAIRMRRTT